MSSRPSACPECGKQGRWGFDDDWCHDDADAAMTCSREGWYCGRAVVLVNDYRKETR